MRSYLYQKHYSYKTTMQSVITSIILLIFQVLICGNRINAQEITKDSAGNRFFETTVRMDDGVPLSTRILLPNTDHPCAAVLMRTPYNKESDLWVDKRFLSHNIAIIIQDVRGKYKSKGDFYAFANERADGLSTLRWIREQPWSNDTVGGWGASYLGYTQWMIADSLNAAALMLTGDYMYDFIYPDGILSLHSPFLWGYANTPAKAENISNGKLYGKLSRLPLSVAADSIDFLSDWLKHEKKDAYWNKLSAHGPVKAPAISIAGWYDIFLKAQINGMQALSVNGNPQNRYIIGPWAHGATGYKNDYGGERKTGSYGNVAFNYMVNALKGKKNDLPLPLKDTRFNLFIMERNEYEGSDVWPPKETKTVPYFLQADHSLSTHASAGDKIFSYVYDPSDPYPSYGGTILGDSVGPALQNRNINRPDQVNFETKVLEQPLTLLGPVSASLWLSSDVPCSDFFVCIQDVFPDGKIINIQDGGSKVHFKGRKPQKQNISVWATGYQLNPGHKLRVTICSSLFPRFNRSLNTCDPIDDAKEMRKASQKIYSGKKMPSSINLPVYTLKD